MQAVLCLVEHNRLRTVDHVVGYLLAAMRWQAMHEDRAAIGRCHKFGVDLIGRQHLTAESLVDVAHRHPAIRDDRVGALHRLKWIADQRDMGAGPLCPFEQTGLRIESIRGCDIEL